jgi:hypothetical protein
MPAPGSIEAEVLAGTELRGMPVSELAVLAGMEGIRFCSKTKLNEYFRGAATIPAETANQLWALWAEVEALCKSFEPFALSLKDGAKVYEWLTAVRNKRIVSVVLVVEG